MEIYRDATARGWSVFPLKAHSKTPAVKDWERWARPDPDPIWWSEPGQGYGIACGPSQLYVIDIDYSEHVNGFVAWYQLQQQHGLAPETYTTDTPRGGLHFYFSCANPPPNTASRLGPGIDTRGSGGYVVGYPPTIDIDPQPLPDWLRPPATRQTTHRPTIRRNSSGTSRYGQQALQTELERIKDAPVGTRNTQLNTSAYRIAQLVAGGEIEHRYAIEQVVYAAMASGLTETEAINTTRSAFQAKNLQPRSSR